MKARTGPELTDTFICHTAQDAGWAAELASQLRGHGLRVSLAEEVRPGDVWVHALERAINESACGIAVISTALLTAPEPLEAEAYAALVHASAAQRRRCIPVLIGGAAPPPLAANLVWRDFTGVSGRAFESRAAELADVISGRASGTPARYVENARVTRTPSAPVKPADRAFVVCYADADADYSHRLVLRLRDAGLPAWSEGDLLPGDDWPGEVRRQLAAAIAVLVLMSPQSQESGDITRMILEGQLRSRPFVPFLLSGDVNYHLADKWYFDARNGRLPDPSLLDVFRKLQEGDAVDGKADPEKVLPAPPGPVITAVRVPPSAGLDLLNRYLSAGEFGYADLQTTALLLEAAGRSAERWLGWHDSGELPLELIAKIDALWSRHCGDRQGFRAQLRRAQVRDGQHTEFTVLSIACGWQDALGADVCGDYEEFIERADGDLRDGFFPTLRSPLVDRRDWYDLWECTVSGVHRRLQDWKGSA
jgi:hypothetical protein